MAGRAFAALLLCIVLVCAAVRSAPARESVEVRGRDVGFYSDRLLLTGDHASVDVPGRIELHADTIRYDLRNDRLLGAGHVHVLLRGEPLDVAAFTIDLRSGIAYAVSTDPLPDTLKIDHERLASATHEAAPGDAFAMADVNGLRPWMRGKHATVTPDVGVRFAPAQFPTGAGINVPSPHFLYVFAPNPNYSSNNLPGSATFDQPYALFTGPHSAELAHFRYDQTYGATLGFDHHLVFGDTTYAIVSAAPLDRPAKTGALTFFQKMGTNYNHRLNATYNVFNSGFNAPLAESLSINYTLSRTLRRSVAQLSLTQNNQSLLPPPPNGQWWGDPTHSWTPNHPFSAELQWNGSDVRFRSGFSYRLSSLVGWDHDAFGLFPRSNDPVPYNTLWHRGLGIFLQSPLFKFHNASFSATAEQDEKWYSYPHRVDDTTLRATASRRLSRTVNLIESFTLQNHLDDYHARQLVFFAPPKLPYYSQDGTPWPGYLAYAGATTNRVYRTDMYYTPSAYFNFSASFQVERDFPQFHGTGNAPYTFGFDMKARPLPNLGIELGRTYSFNWNRMAWSPQWTFAVSP